ncbi:MAG: DASS family sodium-coupled anion symporter [Gammaproteobacteria bacterium]|nr:DASS family sodium-coupled anion symporter [Gammaproteobacteria bacterium]
MTSNSKKILLALILGSLSFILMQLFYTLEQSLLVAILVIMVTLWTNEGLPLAVVSLTPIVLFPAAGILNTSQTAQNYANPIIFLFMGGFLIAIAVEKTNLHKWIANQMLNIFPGHARGIIFALIITSGLLSSVLSNTTTTLLLLPIALFLTDSNKLKVRLALGIAYGASIGGILTPIGTPPNLILFGVMQEMGLEKIAFAQWMWMMFPLVIFMFTIVGFILSSGLKDTKITSELNIPALNSNQKKVITLICFLIIMLFLNSPIEPYYKGLGLNDAGILLSAGLILFAPPFNILNWDQDKNNIPYRIMFLFGAGFSIAMAFTETGMAKEMASYLLELTTLPVILFMLIVAAMVTFTTEVTSNTALISIMLPIVYEVCNLAGLDVRLFMIIATVCASYAFMLPIATPPNAIAMSSGVVNVKTMARYGIVFNLIAIFLTVLVANFFWIHVL